MVMNVRPLQRDELDIVLDWAAAEGWNPGLHDAEVFWAADPQGFVALEQDGQLIGSISLVTYGRRYGFAGLFIVRPEFRGQGIGSFGVEKLLTSFRSRLDDQATIAIDGVFEMQPYYASLGMQFNHRNIRMAGVGKANPAARDACELLAGVPFAEVVAYDTAHFGAPRPSFLQPWIRQAGSLAVAAVADGQLNGYGVVRECREGFKIGPLFAADGDVADVLFAAMSDHAAESPLFLDVPEINGVAMALAADHDMSEVFGCARMTMGPPPHISWLEVFGVTTFELG